MRLINGEEIDIYYIEDNIDINLVINFCIEKSVIALDTETMVNLSKLQSSALDPHSSKISLVQLNSIDNNIPYILDFLSLSTEAKSLFNKKVLMNKDVTKILHYSQFDLKQFYNEFKEWPVNTICSQTLMKSLAVCTGMKASLFRGHGLKDLARDYFDIDLDKNEATSSWGERPLTNNQLVYAGLDVGAPKTSSINSILLEGYYLFKKQLDELNQQFAYEADQQATVICAKMEYQGMYINTTILSKITKYAEEQTNLHRNYLVQELGFTVYEDTIINEDGEWELIYVIPDKIKVLLNNNKGLVNYINEHLNKSKGTSLSSLQAEEIKLYLDVLEQEALIEENEKLFDENYLVSKYDNIKLIKSLLHYKKYSKLLSECLKYNSIINPNTNHIHVGFGAIGTSTGRMSSSGAANLQQVSSTAVVISIDKNQF